jgi:4-amino-4-deoxy-L-arabinose transferase-like glycosyltransferase
MASRLIALIKERPRAVFAGFLAVHAALWTLLPALLYANLPLDLIEALTYGREWQLGYDKLPPLPWWMVEIVHRAIGADFAYYLLSQIVVAGAFALVWLTALPLVGAIGALAAVVIVDGLHYFNFTAPKFNHDVVQLPFWALAGYAFHAALRRGRLGHWALLGFALGAALWAKYFVVVLAVPMAAFILFDREARPALGTPGPYVAAAIALLVASPHLAWLVANDFLPFSYAAARATSDKGALGHLVYPVVFAGGQALWLVPSLAIALPLFYPRPETPQPAAADAFDRRILTLLTFGPALLLVAGSALSGRRLITMWGYPFWLFLGLWLIVMLRAQLERRRLAQMSAAWAAVTALYALALFADYAVLPYLDHRHRASLFPGERFARAMADGFRGATGEPLAYVIGSMWLGGNVSHYAPGHPRTLIDGKPERAPWIDLADLRVRGAVVVWSDGDRARLPDEYAAIAAGAQVQPPLTLPFRRGTARQEFGWAILKPMR